MMFSYFLRSLLTKLRVAHGRSSSRPSRLLVGNSARPMAREVSALPRDLHKPMRTQPTRASLWKGRRSPESIVFTGFQKTC